MRVIFGKINKRILLLKHKCLSITYVYPEMNLKNHDKLNSVILLMSQIV